MTYIHVRLAVLLEVVTREGVFDPLASALDEEMGWWNYKLLLPISFVLT